ncbi:hypothetical protein DFH06DRAFT_1128948 [Mycena polygramma]|nr:hypothetical protein DFH06DRAFT_1128948 [Mycena polygramma]
MARYTTGSGNTREIQYRHRDRAKERRLGGGTSYHQDDAAFLLKYVHLLVGRLFLATGRWTSTSVDTAALSSTTALDDRRRIRNSVGKVRFGSGSGTFSSNAEPELRFGSGIALNLEPERAFRFGSAFERVRTYKIFPRSKCQTFMAGDVQKRRQGQYTHPIDSQGHPDGLQQRIMYLCANGLTWTKFNQPSNSLYNQHPQFNSLNCFAFGSTSTVVATGGRISPQSSPKPPLNPLDGSSCGSRFSSVQRKKSLAERRTELQVQVQAFAEPEPELCVRFSPVQPALAPPLVQSGLAVFPAGRGLILIPPRTVFETGFNHPAPPILPLGFNKRRQRPCRIPIRLPRSDRMSPSSVAHGHPFDSGSSLGLPLLTQQKHPFDSGSTLAVEPFLFLGSTSTANSCAVYTGSTAVPRYPSRVWRSIMGVQVYD